jgi:cell division septation protein DedD
MRKGEPFTRTKGSVMQQRIDSIAQDVPPPAVSPPADAVTAVDEQPAEGEREQEAPQSAVGTEQKAITSLVSTSSLSGASQTTAPQDRYDYDRTSIILVAHLRPANQDGQPRQIWLSVQNGVGNEQDFPLYRLLSEADLGGPWPPAVMQLLEDLRQDLPARRQRYEARLAAKPTTATPSSPAHHAATATTASTKHGKAPAKQAGTSAAATPVPTTSTPIPKQELGMAGLFEGLE